MFSALLTLRSFVGNFVEILAEFDGLFSILNYVDEVPDEAFQARGAGRKKVNLIINEL